MKTNSVRRNPKRLRRIAFAGAMGLLCAWSTWAGAATFADDFSTGLRSTCWSISQSTSNYFTVDASPGNVHLARGSIHNPGGLQGVFVNLNPVLLGGRVAGDFSLQIDFTQAVVPGPGLDQIELHAYFEDGTIFYTVYDRSSGLNAHIWDGASVTGVLPVTGDSGTFRIVRTGSTVTGYFNGTPLASATRSPALRGIAFCLQNNQGSDDMISVSFDNFSMTAASVTPVLDIARTGQQQVLIGWSANAVGYLLEQSSSLIAPAWQVVTNTPSLVGDRFTMGLDAGGAQSYYRLRQQ